jgi:hypothetical protein
MKRNPMRLIPLVATLLLLMPSVALAQEPGVTFDDGPSSKEYAIPLDSARGQTKTKPKAKAKPTPARAVTVPRATTTTTPAKPKKKAKTEKTETTTTPAVAAVPPSSGTAGPVNADRTSSSSDGLSAGVVIAGLAVAALALGGLAGLVIRRRRTPIDEY